jgi:SPX domain protein involved in polyphosphate accumulation
VRDEDISQLKWFVLQHLPVLLQESMGTKSDSQLVNSVYLDNATLELYKCVVVWSFGCFSLQILLNIHTFM